MFIYAGSEQCDLGPIYTITNTQRIKIYPGKLKFILVKISQDPERLHGKHAKENQTLFTFLTTENLPELPGSQECKYGYSDLSSIMLRSHYRNYGEHKGLAVLNSELSKLSP